MIFKVLITLIIGQTLFFKFSGAEESVYIFSKMGIEPWGRLLLGWLELLAILLLWIPQTSLYALILVLCMMSGAIASHLFILGIEIKGDGGQLFILGVVTWLFTIILLFAKREELKVLALKLLGKNHVA